MIAVLLYCQLLICINQIDSAVNYYWYNEETMKCFHRLPLAFLSLIKKRLSFLSFLLSFRILSAFVFILIKSFFLWCFFWRVSEQFIQRINVYIESVFSFYLIKSSF